MTTYQITYETEDGSVEGFMAETNRYRANQIARSSAKESPLNEVFGVKRWFVESDIHTLSTYPVASR